MSLCSPASPPLRRPPRRLTTVVSAAAFSVLIAVVFLGAVACLGSFFSVLVFSVSDSIAESSPECEERTELAVRWRLIPMRGLCRC